MAHVKVKAAKGGGYDVIDHTGNIVDHTDELGHAVTVARIYNEREESGLPAQEESEDSE